MGPVGGEEEPRFAPRWATSWDLAIEELGEDAESIDRQLENLYWRLARWPMKYSYSALRGADCDPTIRITFAKHGMGSRLRVWYRFDDPELEFLWVDVAPYDDGQDDPVR